MGYPRPSPPFNKGDELETRPSPIEGGPVSENAAQQVENCNRPRGLETVDSGLITDGNEGRDRISNKGKQQGEGFSLVQIENPVNLNNFQEVIARAMKEAMATQFKDWFGSGKRKNIALQKDCKEDRVQSGDDKSNKSSKSGDQATNDSDSQGSFVPATFGQSQPQVEKEDQTMEIGSSTRIMIEACEQLSRERKQAEQDENEQEKEVISPATKKKRNTPKESEATRTSIRQLQKRGGKMCTRGETAKLAEKRKQSHLSPGTNFTLFDFLPDDVLLYIANSCGVSLKGDKGDNGYKYLENWWSDRSCGRPAIGVQ